MTDLSDKFDTLPPELEPTGAAQVNVCTWTRQVNGNHETTCGETWPVFIGLPDATVHCPWCGRERAHS